MVVDPQTAPGSAEGDERVGAEFHSSGMKRRLWNADSLFDLSSTGVVTRRQLREAGVSDAAIDSRCAPGGPWQRLLPGVVLLRNGHPSTLERSAAALAYGGPMSMITGCVGLDSFGYGTNGSAGEVHLLLPAQMRRASVSFVRAERTWRLPKPITKGSIRVAPLVRSLVDATRAAKSETRCVALLTEVLQRDGVSIDEIATELAEGPRRYSALTRRVLLELRDNAHSVAELEDQRLYRSSGLPPMTHNCDIYAPSGEFIAKTDGWIDSVALAREIDSVTHHLSPADYQRTQARRNRMQAHGLIVVSHSPQDIRDRPTQVLDDLRKNYQHALARPRPDVVMVPRQSAG